MPDNIARILIVDDEPVNIRLLSNMLKGYERIAATDGYQALELARKSTTKICPRIKWK